MPSSTAPTYAQQLQNASGAHSSSAPAVQGHGTTGVTANDDMDGYDDDPPAHYPKPGDGLARTMRPESEDLQWLVDDNFEVFSHLDHYGKMVTPQYQQASIAPGPPHEHETMGHASQPGNTHAHPLNGFSMPHAGGGAPSSGPGMDVNMGEGGATSGAGNGA